MKATMLLSLSKMARTLQLSLPQPRTWGGRRAGAGRKRTADRRPGVPHRTRPVHVPTHPVHVTLRSTSAVRCLRSARAFPAVRRALAVASHAGFRILHFSVQDDHLHLIVEADDRRALGRGLRGLAIRVARAVNRALGRRGRVWDERYHARALTTPRAMRHCSPETLRGRTRTGPLLVGAVVRRVAGARHNAGRSDPRGPRAHLARGGRLATTRSDLVRRAATR